MIKLSKNQEIVYNEIVAMSYGDTITFEMLYGKLKDRFKPASLAVIVGTLQSYGYITRNKKAGTITNNEPYIIKFAWDGQRSCTLNKWYELYWNNNNGRVQFRSDHFVPDNIEDKIEDLNIEGDLAGVTKLLAPYMDKILKEAKEYREAGIIRTMGIKHFQPIYTKGE